MPLIAQQELTSVSRRLATLAGKTFARRRESFERIRTAKIPVARRLAYLRRAGPMHTQLVRRANRYYNAAMKVGSLASRLRSPYALIGMGTLGSLAASLYRPGKQQK